MEINFERLNKRINKLQSEIIAEQNALQNFKPYLNEDLFDLNEDDEDDLTVDEEEYEDEVEEIESYEEDEGAVVVDQEDEDLEISDGEDLEESSLGRVYDNNMNNRKLRKIVSVYNKLDADSIEVENATAEENVKAEKSMKRKRMGHAALVAGVTGLNAISAPIIIPLGALILIGFNTANSIARRNNEPAYFAINIKKKSNVLATFIITSDSGRNILEQIVKKAVKDRNMIKEILEEEEQEIDVDDNNSDITEENISETISSIFTNHLLEDDEDTEPDDEDMELEDDEEELEVIDNPEEYDTLKEKSKQKSIEEIMAYEKYNIGESDMESLDTSESILEDAYDDLLGIRDSKIDAFDYGAAFSDVIKKHQVEYHDTKLPVKVKLEPNKVLDEDVDEVIVNQPEQENVYSLVLGKGKTEKCYFFTHDMEPEVMANKLSSTKDFYNHLILDYNGENEEIFNGFYMKTK